jgi:alkylation response protein AidB-like acyl-CoA dehydrogenase
MTFTLTTDQRDLADGVASLLANRATGVYIREVISGAASWRDLWDEVAELGIAALTVGEEDGGLGLGAIELAAVSEACGRFLVPGPVVATAGWFVPLVSRAGGEAAAAALGPVLEGRVGATLAFADPLTAAGTVRLEGGRLAVADLLMPDAERVGYIAFVVDGESGPVLAVAVADALEIEMVDGLDPTRPLARVSAAGADAAVSSLGDVPAPLAVPLVAAAAELVGAAARMLEISVQYAGEREQFGTKIGAFQGIKHRLVDVLLSVERARSLTYRAAVLADADEPDAAALQSAAHLALAAAAECATETGRSAVQVHGGVGVTAEHDISLYYLRARQASMQLGGRDGNYLAAARSFVAGGETG